ncbi:frataxin-like, mitochondrial precursor [Trypanosoma grayi]|uniref:frataxin-like, mitochondrial precursor n=1 Tax=Trypanosoma grayi TaxID=71804 RepID=UPI0004F40596|nr:frataxin-like, mitochondrial precursor [Trypanosoma grayi]KEG09272.1 frataxin-like, mitochondrial precursor [Trypanosoma grayi]
MALLQMRRVGVAAATAAGLTSVTRVTGCGATTTPWRWMATTRVALGEKGVRYSGGGMEGFTDATYNTAADAFLEHVDNVLEEIDSSALEDVSLSGGVLSIETASKGTFVLNKQAPNAQLWLSSPVSGPHHYDMILPEGRSKAMTPDVVRWLANSDGHCLQEKLERELTDTLGVEVKL